MSKAFAALSILVGGLGTVLSLCVAFGVEITPDQHSALLAVGSLALLVVGVWFHPAVPIGQTTDPPTDDPTVDNDPATTPLSPKK